MKVFISHSSKDATMAKKLSIFLESLNPSIEVFCSSQTGSIRVGRDFVKVITKELNGCDTFIPLLTKNYYESHFCMVELGFAYSCLSNNRDDEDDYIYPLAVAPIKKDEALMNTPMARIQVCSINDPEDMKAYIEAVCEGNKLQYSSGLNKRLHEFIYDMNKIIFETFDMISKTKILLCKSANVSGEDQDYLKFSITEDGYAFNFRAKPFENSVVYPDFLSTVFQYIDYINLYDMVNIYEKTKLSFEIDNYTNSISKIDIELKHSGTNLLHRQTVMLGDGLNKIVISLRELKCEALKQVSEICFVIKPSAYIEDEGMFEVKNLSVEAK